MMNHAEFITLEHDPAQSSPRATVQPKVDVLLWHLGRAGAGSKFTFELGRGLSTQDRIALRLCAAQGSDLAVLGTTIAGGVATVRTFAGAKSSLAGRIAAAAALLRLPQIGRAFQGIVGERDGTVALCAFQSIWDAALVPFLRRRAGRFVLVLHDALFHPGDGYPLRARVLRRQVAAADALIVLSDHVGRMAQETYGFPAARIWTVPHGAFTFGDDRAVAKSLPGTRPVRLLFLGRIVAYKGLGLLLNAYALLRARGVDVEIEIMGEGSLGRDARTLEGLPGVTLTNRWVEEPEIAAALARADIVVLPYVEASQSGVAAAAMAAGVPVVATPVGGLAEQVSHGVTGLVAETLDPEALAAAIESLATDAALYATCSAGALERARGEMSWDRVAALVAGIVSEVSRLPRRGERIA